LHGVEDKLSAAALPCGVCRTGFRQYGSWMWKASILSEKHGLTVECQIVDTWLAFGLTNGFPGVSSTSIPPEALEESGVGNGR
jgi:hypothetical protein